MRRGEEKTEECQSPEDTRYNMRVIFLSLNRSLLVADFEENAR